MSNSRLRERIRYLEPIPSGQSPGGKLTKPIRAILFDIYGTLFISQSGDVGVAEKNTPRRTDLAELCRHHAIQNAPEELSRKLIDTIHKDHRERRTAGVRYPEVEIDKIWQRVLGWQDRKRLRAFALEYEWTANPCYPMPGLDHTLRVIRRRNLVMGIISNAQFYTASLFELFLGASATDLGFAPDLTCYSYRFGLAKPSAGLYGRCTDGLERRGISPSSVVYVGNDMLNDMMPATHMGWQTVLFAGDRRSLRLRRDHDACRQIRPDLVVTDLRQLLEWL
jgi:putative hydrolase of the HAD superfamily